MPYGTTGDRGTSEVNGIAASGTVPIRVYDAKNGEKDALVSTREFSN